MPAVNLGFPRGEGHRRPQVEIRPAEAKCRGHHHNHGIALAAECNRLIEDFWIAAKPPLPQPITQDHYVVASRLVFFRQKVPTQLRLRAEHCEKTVGDFHSPYLFRVARPDHIKRYAVESY